MARNESKRLRPTYLKSDQEALTALKNIGNYAPANPSFSTDKLQAALNALETAHGNEVNAQNALATARDACVAAEWELHNLMLGAKLQIRAQFGDDSNEAQALGLVKKSERKHPKRHAKPAAQKGEKA